MADGRFVAYYRVSTARQGRSGLGLDAQKKAVADYLNGGRWKIIAEFTEIESGRKSDRPALALALAACRVHRCPLVVAKVDRLTRSSAFLSRLIDAGVDVRFCDLPQIEGPTGRFMLQQMASVAELEAGLIGDRTKKALASKRDWYARLTSAQKAQLRRAGKATQLGGYRGAKLTKDTIALGRAAIAERVDARAADLAPVIVEIRKAGADTLADMAAALTARGIPTARGNTRWQPTQVARLLARMGT